MERAFVLFICFLCASQHAAGSGVKPTTSYKPVSLYDITMSVEPVTVQILKPALSSSRQLATFDLVYTTGIGEIRRLSDLPSLINQPKLIRGKTDVVTSRRHLVNPTKVGILPKNTVDKQSPVVWWITAGVFSSVDVAYGAIYLMKVVTEKAEIGFRWEPVSIYTRSDAVFSHIEWLDMDIDGRRDCVTIRDTQADGAQLLWLRQPPINEKVWDENPISNASVDLGGSDFRLIRWSRKRKNFKMFVVAGKRTNSVTVIWNEDSDNDWTQTHRLRSRVIARYDQFVSIEVGDVNGDQRPDVLVTVAAISGKPGRLVVYEVPLNNNFAAGKWRKHVLAEWHSQTKYYLISPRSATLFYPNVDRSRKPHILVSGGSDKKVYVVSPNTWRHFDWDYTVHEIFSDKFSVGTPAVEDVDGDGNAEIFIPSGKRIHVMRFALSSGCVKVEGTFFSLLLVLLTTTLVIGF